MAKAETDIVHAIMLEASKRGIISKRKYKWGWHLQEARRKGITA
jgi:hypothetical protein